MRIEPLRLFATLERWPLAAPLRITGYIFESVELLHVSLTRGDHTGEGEAAGVYYRGDTPSRMLDQIQAHRLGIEAGLSRESLQTLLPSGGARNALDCALWDLESKLTGQPAWRIAGLEHPTPLVTTFTCGAEPAELSRQRCWHKWPRGTLRRGQSNSSSPASRSMLNGCGSYAP